MADAPDPFEEYRRKFELYSLHISPHTERFAELEKVALKGATEFAQHGLKALVLLNGGAVLLTPTAQKMFGPSSTLSNTELLHGVACFCAGLAVVLIAYIFAFYQQQMAVFYMSSSSDEYTADSILKFFPPEDADELQAQKDQLDNLGRASKRYGKWTFGLQTAAAVASVISFLCFAAGSFVLIVGAMC